MSYDLAVWEGDRPADERTAGCVFNDLYDRYLDGETQEPPSGSIADYVTALLERWCDVTEDKAGTPPWPVGPLIDCASGPLICFRMDWRRAEEASAYAAHVTHVMLVCFDVQQNQLRP
ncbi:hypothetical protein GCM10010300_80230 [Streptomyces olivaceoviridis]|uniref:hypothetical protein n=1 Tax=Streptomyces olivaceoviridis TaxID=1921 RepID=UPI00167AE2A8|nr:hypothetical protein [Streptomyces olivaceoviridis]GGZ24718.1 hypothetical protein GCM10010300_80230 [Streptomyces olivaceoviridis]